MVPKNNSDHWENVTDNVEALLDMVLANVPALRFQKVPTNVDYVIRLFSFTGRIAIGRLERGVLKEGMPISLVKETVQ
jgi:GTP-binding protein